MATEIQALTAWLAEISDLRRAAAILHWDRNTMMPPLGASVRREALATLERVTHERLASQRTAELVGAAAVALGSVEPDAGSAQIVSEARRLHEKARRVPSELAAARAAASAEGYEVWVRARAQDDFAAYAPVLTRNFELARAYAGCFDGYEDPYDALLDDFAPGMRTAQAHALLSEMRERLLPLIQALAGLEVDRAALDVRYPVAGQRDLVATVLGWMGFDERSWRLDDTVHPFESSFGVDDVRITTRYEENHFPTALYAAMHECGHGLYEAGIARDLQRTPLGTIRSSAIHESQSRLWENMVGRSRAFCGALAPVVAESSRGALTQLDAGTLFRAVNAVVRSPIRIEADETTYGMHIVLRFELERALLGGEIEVVDLPGEWNARMRDYLGVEVASDAEGVMQDVHWSEGLIGYFPTYAIGNLIAAALWERAHAEIAGLEDLLAAHDLGPLREWLRLRVHMHGSRFSDAELLERVLGGPVRVAPFIDHLKATLGDVYGRELA